MNKEELFSILYGKDTVEAYQTFQDLENSIQESNALYLYFDEFLEMLHHEKSYIRVRGFRLLCKLARIDTENKLNHHLTLILRVLKEEKPTALRQYLSSLPYFLLYKIECKEEVEKALRNIDTTKYKDSMAPLIQKDIAMILENID